MKKLLFFLSVLLLFGSCSIQKRHYRKGFYIPGGTGDQNVLVRPLKPLQVINGQKKTVSQTNEITASSVSPVTPVEVEFHPRTKKTIHSTLIQIEKQFPVNPDSYQEQKNKPAFYSGILPNNVAQAAFRMLIISLVLLGVAGAIASILPDLVYITISVLGASILFAVVSLITAVNARKDKINNSKGWLLMALFTLILDILIITVATLFIILLF